jgi:hypothetical protein
MNNYQDKSVEFAQALLVLASIFLILVIVFVPRLKCDAHTNGMKIEHRFVYFGGCQVYDPTAGWVPLSNYRVM